MTEPTEDTEFTTIVERRSGDAARRALDGIAAREFLADAGVDVDNVASEIESRVVSAFVRARKPLDAVKSTPCCEPGCCP